MPEFTPSTGMFTSDPSHLSLGWKPGFLCCITEENIPDGWEMRKKGATRMYRWHFAIWERPGDIAAGNPPEHQTAISSKNFSPAGTKNPASKAWLWTVELLRRRPEKDESVNLDPLMPLPCQVKIDRYKKDGTPIDYARILDIGSWPDGADVLSHERKQRLVTLAAEWQEDSAAPASSAHSQRQGSDVPPHSQTQRWQSQPPPRALSSVNPAMVGWGNPAGEVKPPPIIPTW